MVLPSDTRIWITREFNAHRRLVSLAYLTPERIKRWWPTGRGAVTVAEINLRAGGRWRGMKAGRRDALDLLEQVTVELSKG